MMQTIETPCLGSSVCAHSGQTTPRTWLSVVVVRSFLDIWCSCWLAYLRPPLLKSINDDAKLYFFHSRTAYCGATFRVVYLGFDLLDEGDCYCHTLPWGAARNCKTMSALCGLDFMSSLVVRNNNNCDSSTVWEASPVHGDRQAGRSDKRPVYR